MKHERWQLEQKQSLPLETKIEMSQRRIQEWHDHWEGNVYLAFSGGKDSTVLLHLIRDLGLPIYSLHNNTGVEYPEISRFVRETAQEVDITIRKPKMGFSRVIQKYGYPFPSKEQARLIQTYRWAQNEESKDKLWYGEGLRRINYRWRFLVNSPYEVSDHCCYVLKKSPATRFEKQTKAKPIVGLRASESNLRATHYLKYGCNSYDRKRPTSYPLSFWTEQDILVYIRQKNVKIADIYGKIIEKEGALTTTGATTTGCMPCLFGIHLEDYPNRFQKMKETHPDLYQHFVYECGLDKFMDYVGVRYW